MKYLLKGLFLCLMTLSISQAQVQLNYYLPDSVSYNKDIPTPASIIGHEVGEWHVTHDKLVYYMRAVAKASDRISLIETGKTYEGRPQLLLAITHPENISQLAEIRKQHKALTEPSISKPLDVENMPVVTWMGYSIHGNEPSGSNAAMLTAYYLAAAQGTDIDDKLKDVVVLLDPSFNPDGLNRFATWANMHKSDYLVTDPNDREFNEVWPGGRTNHYWFDLNRDWLPGQLVESQNRLKQFHDWKPNILTDHHEMGTNSTFFFQPGIPSRTHPITPLKNQDLTAKIGEYHAKYLDAAGSLYFTKESYDDFYYGKGSTFPDVQGAVGILFEQASSRGHAQESVHGILKFPFTIKNQFITSLSTFQAAYEMRIELLTYQRNFYLDAQKEAEKSSTQAWIVSDKDASKLYEFAALLKRHEIEVYKLKEAKKSYSPESSYIIPIQQYQSRLINAVFEKRTSFTDSLFYDISAWTLPLAFNLEYTALSGKEYSSTLLGDLIGEQDAPKATMVGEVSNYAYALEWTDYYAPKALYKLQDNGLKVKVANESFIGPDGHMFNRGTIIIAVQQQQFTADKVYNIISKSIENTGASIYSLHTGSTGGVNLGSRTFSTLETPQIAMIIGEGTSSYDAGEIWHLADQRFQIPITKIDVSDLRRADLSRYNTLIIPNLNNANSLSSSKKKIEEWVSAGGNLIAIENAAKWASDNKLSKVTFKKDSSKLKGFLNYEDYGNKRGAQAIGGSIFKAKVDLSHPLLYGYSDSFLPIFKGNSLFMEPTINPYASPIRYTKNSLLSGYISEEKKLFLEDSPVIAISRNGQGSVISFCENPNFRAFWYGTNRLFLNAIFFGQVINSATAE
ncbi:MAG: hypothetical protein ACJAT1_001640 [Marivirga sp.]|jgi:hypothetical protein